MKRHGNLYPQIYAFANLLRAAQKAQKGKRAKPNVAQFNFHLEGELLRLQRQLRDQTWQPGRSTTFYNPIPGVAERAGEASRPISGVCL